MGWLRPLPVVFAALALAACRAAPYRVPPRPDPVVTALEIVTPAAELQAAHRVDVKLDLASDLTVEAVGVAFRLFPKVQYEVHDPNIVSWVLGSSAYDVTAPGGQFTAQLELPYDVPEGDYVVVTEIDPLDTIAERDEEDQLGAPVPIHVLVERRDQTRLMLDEPELDTPAFELSFVTTDTPPEPIGLTLVVGAEAAAPVEGAVLSACLRAPGGDCTSLPFDVWNGSAADGSFQRTLPLPAVVPGDPTSVHLDLRLAPALEASFAALERSVSTACVAGVDACVAQYGLRQPCTTECLGTPPPTAEHADWKALDACLLKCIPFTVEASLEAPGVTLYDPPGASPGRKVTADLQLAAPPPVTPLAPAVLSIRSLTEPIFRREGADFPQCDRNSIDLVADKGTCQEPVVWSVTQDPVWQGWPIGTIAGADTTAVYSPYVRMIDPPWGYMSCIPLASRDDGITKVHVRATACGQTAELVIAELNGPGASVSPKTADVLIGATGTLEFKALISSCTVSADTTWSIVEANDGSLGTIERTADPLTVNYRPPASLAAGAATATLRAYSASCDRFDDTATIHLGYAKSLAFEKSFDKSFGGSFFGAGVNLHGGASVDATGGHASAYAIVPVRVFGKEIELLSVKDDATVDPRKPDSSTFTHRMDAFEETVANVSCPGADICTGTAKLWSTDKCMPGGDPPVCRGTGYLKACKKTSDCAGLAGLSCRKGLCTKKCDEPSDCQNGLCEGVLGKGKFQQTFVIVVIPVTVEGSVCAEFGVDASLALLPAPDHNSFALKVGPYFEVNGYASAAIGYTGILAVGIRGEIVLLRNDLYAEAKADLTVVAFGPNCPLAGGCFRGKLTESLNDVLQGGSGLIYLFADYPTIRWCTWYPCFGTARAKKTLASWGPLFEQDWTCDSCDTAADCGVGVSCVDGECADGHRALVCRHQSYFMSVGP